MIKKASLAVVSLLCIYSCRNAPVNKIVQHKLQFTDTLKIKAESIFRIYMSKIPAANGRDSLLLLLDRNASLLYKIDTATHLLGIDTLPERVTDGLIAFTFYKGKYHMLYENLLKIFPDGDFGINPKQYSFSTSNGDAYHSAISEFKIDINGSFLIYCIPKLNIGEVTGRTQYFSSKIVHRGIIKEGKVLIETQPLEDITFPERYRKFYYNDLYPVFCSLGEDIVAYTVQYCDSIALISGGKKEYFKIPKQFSVAAASAPEACVQSKTESSAYFATHSANGKLLKYKQKILLFQVIGADQYYDEQSGMINDLLSREKRIVIFNIDKKQFEQTAYELPKHCNPIKSFVFNGKVYLLSTDDTRKTILVTAFQL
ncbi:hypothetical protein [Edaphocola aurantiacus]|uniref:hypothetical protein n=1 Tax=Edaphocola aurantiacus TaxID=2601682 RepID=UPI001C97AB86|nr:hypothetical protein [Edaphocola aurantiacus]